MALQHALLEQTRAAKREGDATTPMITVSIMRACPGIIPEMNNLKLVSPPWSSSSSAKNAPRGL